MTAALPEAAFESAAELFGLLSEPMRLKLVCHLFGGERNVSQLLQRVGASQSTVSRHLATLYRGGLLARRREGTHIFYRIADPRLAVLRDNVCREARCGVAGPATDEERQ